MIYLCKPWYYWVRDYKLFLSFLIKFNKEPRKLDKGSHHHHGNKWIFWWNTMCFRLANEKSYVPTTLESYVWTVTEVAIYYALYLHVPKGHPRNCEKWPKPSHSIQSFLENRGDPVHDDNRPVIVSEQHKVKNIKPQKNITEFIP